MNSFLIKNKMMKKWNKKKTKLKYYKYTSGVHKVSLPLVALRVHDRVVTSHHRSIVAAVEDEGSYTSTRRL